MSFFRGLLYRYRLYEIDPKLNSGWYVLKTRTNPSQLEKKDNDITIKINFLKEDPNIIEEKCLVIETVSLLYLLQSVHPSVHLV